jgi:hypothetical protein
MMDVPEPRPDELPGGAAFRMAWDEATTYAADHPADLWNRLSEGERSEFATTAAVTRRRMKAPRMNGHDRSAPIDVAPSIGTRTAADLRHGDPPDQLAGHFLTPEGPTILYGRGGVGKGVTACWLAQRLVAAGHVPMIVDFEGHEREWGSRLRGLGMSDDELARVHYRAPFDGRDWTAPTGALSAVAGAIRDDAERVGATYLIVDSYSLATSNGDTMGGEAAAREYFAGLSWIGLPSLTLAHVRGDTGRFPDRPFGSVHVHNFARETWAAEPGGMEPAAADPDEVRFGPHVVALEFRNQKANGRERTPVQFLTFSFHVDGSIEAHADPPKARTVAELASDVLGKGPMTYRELIAAIHEDTGQKVTEDGLRKALERAPQRFRWDNDKRPGTWVLR